MTQSAKGQFVQFPLHLIYDCPQLTRDDKWVLLTIMGECWTDKAYRLSYREIASLSGVSLSLLSSYTNKKTKELHEGIIDHIIRVTGYITVIQDKEINPTTGQPKGQTQSYITVNYSRIWQDNIAYSEKKRPQSVSHTNASVLQANTSVLYTNASVSHTNDSVSVARSEMPPYITKIDQTITDKEDHVEMGAFDASASVSHPLHSFLFLDDAIAPKVLTVYLTSEKYESEMEDKRRGVVAGEVKHDLEQRGHLVTYRWVREQEAPVVDASKVVDKSQKDNQHGDTSHSDPLVPGLRSGDPHLPGADSRQASGPGGEPDGRTLQAAAGDGHRADTQQEQVTQPSSYSQQQESRAIGDKPSGSKNPASSKQETLLEAPLAEPPMDGAWVAEKVVQYAEWRNGKRYTEKTRTGQIEAARAFHRDDANLTLEQFKQGYDDWFGWWQEHKGPLHVSDLRVKQKNGIVRLYSALERIEAQKKRAQFQVIKPSTEANHQRAVSPNQGSALLSPEKQERNKQRLRERVAASKAAQQGQPPSVQVAIN